MFCFNNDKLEQFLCTIRTSNPLSPNKKHFHKIALMSSCTRSSPLKACTAKAKLTSEHSPQTSMTEATLLLSLWIRAHKVQHAPTRWTQQQSLGAAGTGCKAEHRAPLQLLCCTRHKQRSQSLSRSVGSHSDPKIIQQGWELCELYRVLSTLEQSLSGGTTQLTRNPH